MTTTADTLTLHCSAKLNLTLAVGPPRQDGLHPIASVMVALDFGDELTLRRLECGPSTFARQLADDAPKPLPIDWPIESDLIYRAHALLEQASGRALPIACVLHKRIPSGAGLGGGSSDAAGMLVGLRKLFNLTITDQSLLSLSGELGADVTFLVHALLGQTAAIVTGIGDIIEPLPALPSFHTVLVLPDGECATPAVYHAFDQGLADTAKPIDQRLIQNWANSNSVPEAHNDLTDAAIAVCPAIQTAMQAVRDRGFEPRLTGSGSALFVVMPSQADATSLAASLSQSGIAARAAMF